MPVLLLSMYLRTAYPGSNKQVSGVTIARLCSLSNHKENRKIYVVTNWTGQASDFDMKKHVSCLLGDNLKFINDN